MHPLRLLVLTAALLATVVPAGAEPASLQVLRKTADAYRAMRAYHDHTVLRVQSKAGGKLRRQESRATFTFERPNRLRVEAEGAGARSTAVCDGEHLWLYSPGLKQVLRKPVPEGSAAPLASVVGMDLMAQTLIADKPLDAILEGVKSHRLLGRRKLGARETYLVEMDQPGLGIIRLWIGTKGFLIHQASVELRRGDSGAAVVSTEMHQQIQVDPILPAGAFAFTPPKGAKVVDGFVSPTGEERAR